MHITGDTRRILNDSTLIDGRDQWFQKLENVFSGQGNNYIPSVNGFLGQSGDPGLAYTDPEQWVIECLDDLAASIPQYKSDIMFRPAYIEYAAYGVHFIDKILDADVFYQDGQWYNHYLNTPVGSLKYPDLASSPTWQMAQMAALTFIKQEVRLPLFGLPTLSSALNIAVNLYGQDILLAMLTEPDKARKDLSTINRLLCDLHQWYRSVLP